MRLDREVLELTEDEGLEAEIQNADDYKDGIYSAIVGIDELSMKSKRPAMTDTTPTGTVHAAASPASERENRIKLTIRPFDSPSG